MTERKGNVKWLGTRSTEEWRVFQKAVGPKYSKVSESIRHIAPSSLQCSMFCGGKNCKYDNPSKWKEHEMAIKGLYSSWISDKILAMARPSTFAIEEYGVIDQFKKNGINAVINLQHPGEHASCGFGLEAGGFTYVPQDLMEQDVFFYNFGWDDYGVRALQSILDMVKVMDFALLEGKAAVHCHAGLGRTGVLIACYFVYSDRMEAVKAIHRVREKRPKSIQTRGQIACVKDFAKYLKPMRTIFAIDDNDDKRFGLGHFLRRQRHILHGEEERKLRYVPKIVFVICKRLLELAGIYFELETITIFRKHKFCLKKEKTNSAAAGSSVSSDSGAVDDDVSEESSNGCLAEDSQDRDVTFNRSSDFELNRLNVGSTHHIDVNKGSFYKGNSGRRLSCLVSGEEIVQMRFTPSTKIGEPGVNGPDILPGIGNQIIADANGLTRSSSDSELGELEMRRSSSLCRGGIKLKPLNRSKKDVTQLSQPKMKPKKSLDPILLSAVQSQKSRMGQTSSEESAESPEKLKENFLKEKTSCSLDQLVVNSASEEVAKQLACRKADIKVVTQIDRYKKKLNTSSSTWQQLEYEEDPSILSGLLWAWLEHLEGPIFASDDLNAIESEEDYLKALESLNRDALIKFLFEKEALETKHERLRNFGVTAYTIVLTKRLALCMKRNLMAKVLSFQKDKRKTLETLVVTCIKMTTKSSQVRDRLFRRLAAVFTKDKSLPRKQRTGSNTSLTEIPEKDIDNTKYPYAGNGLKLLKFLLMLEQQHYEKLDPEPKS